MTKDKARKLVDKFISKYKEKANISHWTITAKFIEEQEFYNKNKTLASINADDVYLNAEIFIYPAFFKENIKEQEKIIAHEISHCLTNPIADLCGELISGKLVTSRELEKETEKLTEIIAILMTRDL